MKRTLLATVLTLLSAFAFAQEKIAVFPFEDLDNILTKNESVFFYRQFSNEFTNKNSGRFTIVPRQDVEKLINTEAAFQLSDFSARDKTAEMQRVLNGTQILSGVIGRRDSGIAISVSVYTYPELAHLGGVDKLVANKDELFSKIPELVQEMQNAIEGIRTYKIGDRGPAGGIIFYDKGNNTGGWRYMELAPFEFDAPWGPVWRREMHISSISPRVRTEIGSGKQNTILLNDWLIREGMKGMAAQLCTNLEINGFSDWFLPSLQEMFLIYENITKKSLEKFNDTWYWSSSMDTLPFYGANLVNLTTGEELPAFDDFDVTNTCKVRAVRAF